VTGTHGNNFNPLRLIAASLVIVSHGIELPSGVAQRDILHALTGHTLSWFAVGIFFAISGYLIVESWLRQPNLLRFLRARALRIVPGLAVMLLVTVPLLGLLFSTLPFGRFMSDPGTIAYMFGNLSIFLVRYDLPGVFTGNPLTAVNGSLWTLRYELLCYASVAILGVAGLLARQTIRRAVLIGGLLAAIASGITIALGPPPTGRLALLVELSRLFTCFILGGLYREFQHAIALRAILLVPAWLAVILAAGTPIAPAVGSFAATYTAFYLAFAPQADWLKPMRTGPDYSYGIYIYAFPIQQALVALFPGWTSLANMMVAFALTLPFAMVSWHFVEKPALRLKGKPRPSVSSRAAGEAG
jgi:peptidoglycan/LPS O-acetylase OafA/YrhL